MVETKWLRLENLQQQKNNKKKQNKTYNLLLWNIVEEDKVAEHGDEAEEVKSNVKM